jgi:hypothetical protein
MAPRKPKRPDYSGSLASYKQSVADKPKGLDLPSPTQVVNWASGIVASGRTAAGQTQPLTPGDQGLRTLGQGISLANTYLNPYANTTRKALGAAVNRDRQSLTALSKSAALDAVITGTAMAAGKGIQMGINSAIKSGIPARIGNKITGQTVLVHGSPVRGIQELNPSFSRAQPNEARVFGMRTDIPLNVQGATQSVVTGYAEGSSWAARGLTVPEGGGSLYAFKTPKKTTDLPLYPKLPKTPQFTESGRPIIQLPPSVATSSKSPGKVVGEVTLRGKTPGEVQAALRAELKKAGVKVQPNIVEKMMTKAEAKKLAARAKNNPPVV